MRFVGGVLLVASLALLSGCSAPEAGAPPAAATPTPSATPVFASEEAALAAAEEAYREYLRVYDEVLSRGGEGADALDDVLVGAALDDGMTGAEEFQDQGLTAVGERTIDRLELQRVDETGVSVYVCESARGVDVTDANGASLVSDDRPDLTPFEVRILVTTEGARISERTLWTGDGLCDG